MTDKLIGNNPLSTGPGEPGPAGRGMPVRVNLTLPVLILPLLTILGLADNPGEATGWGAIDPAVVRDLATAAAQAGQQSEWHLTLVDENGWAIGHGCATPRAGTRDPRRRTSGPSPADAPTPATRCSTPPDRPSAAP